MRIDKRFDDVEVPSRFHATVDWNIGQALERHSRHVREVRVQFQDVNASKGGPDIKCTLVAEVAGSKTLVIEERAGNPASAVSQAAGRLSKAVRRHVDKLQNHRSGLSLA